MLDRLGWYLGMFLMLVAMSGSNAFAFVEWLGKHQYLLIVIAVFVMASEIPLILSLRDVKR